MSSASYHVSEMDKYPVRDWNERKGMKTIAVQY